MKQEAAWDGLLARHLDGQCTAADMKAINERLRADPAARAEFAALLNLDSALAGLALATEPAMHPPRMCWLTPAPRIAALAALLAVLLTGSWWLLHDRHPFATVMSSAGSGLTKDLSVRDEPLMIQAGSVELLTKQGARIVIEAPAAFRFESPQRLHLQRGRAAAEVPPSAKGFTIVTASGEAVDLGTKFGVDASSAGSAEIHVFQGEVIAHAKGGRPQRSLRDGEALTLQAGAEASRDLRSGAFIRPDEMAALTAGLIAGQQTRSEAALADLRRDPALIALLDFEENSPLPGTFRMVQGRWPGSKAPEFVAIGDHMKLVLGGDRAWPQLTLAAWVRLDRLGQPYQSLYHTDGWHEDKPGQVHWMINRDTTMRLALRQNLPLSGKTTYGTETDSQTPVLPERGRWVHLVTVYDAPARTVRYYLNGALDKEVRLQVAHPARLGPAQIGNWNQTDRKLSGRVDEFFLLGRAMTDTEVQSLHAAGNPYR